MPDTQFKERAVIKRTCLLLITSACIYFICHFAAAETTGLAKKQNWAYDHIIVKFKKNLPEQRVKQINTKHGTSLLYTSPFAGFKRIKVPIGKTAEQTVKIYKNLPEVDYAELNYYAYAHFEPNDLYYQYQWHFQSTGGINLEPAWEITTGEPNIIVAVIDTGVAYENYKQFEMAPDLANTRFVQGYDIYNKDGHPNDDDGHGTHVTGTIAQSTNNSIGTAGIAFNCSIMPVKVLSKRGTAPYSIIADGVYFAVNNGAKIINMSLGGADYSITLRDAVAYAYTHGVTCICSAGNDYPNNNIQYPAGYNDYCIAVGATRFDRTRSYYSNTGSYIDLVAPGGDLNVYQSGDNWPDGILQQTFDKNVTDWVYAFYQGTSMSAPHVSGVAAMLASLGITHPDDIREALQNTAIDLGTAGRDDTYGWGLVDAFAALNYFFEEGDFDKNGKINFEDLNMLTNYWLEDRPSIDIYPDGGDGIINFLDLAKFVNIWEASIQ